MPSVWGSPSSFEMEVRVQSPNVVYGEEFIDAVYHYDRTSVRRDKGIVFVEPESQRLQIRTAQKVPRVGVALVGWGGNNGSTFTAASVANRLGLTWRTKEGERQANWFGSLTQSSTVNIGTDATGAHVHVPMSDIVPMLHPNNIEIDGWDISSENLEGAMQRARVLDIQLQEKLAQYLREIKPRPAIFDIGFVATNQADRADNVLSGTKWEKMEKVREDIRDFKLKKNLDSVIVLWTANTERFCDVVEGLNDTADSLLESIKNNEAEISPSTLYAVAAILEGCTFINGSPQNTFVPGCVDLAERKGIFIAGDDFKSGQTKLKSVLVDFLVGAGIKPTSIVSYNHLGNNDGKNLSAPQTFRSKEISKSNVVDDMVASNSILYKPGEKLDHVVVIKYVPYVGDTKKAMDEYTSEILMGGRNTLVIHNTCEDSLLATPLILDLVILAELCGRISFRKMDKDGQPIGEFVSFHPVLSLLSYLVKAPMVPEGAPIVNSLFRQRACIENILRACVGLRPESAIDLDQKLYEPVGLLQRTQK